MLYKKIVIQKLHNLKIVDSLKYHNKVACITRFQKCYAKAATICYYFAPPYLIASLCCCTTLSMNAILDISILFCSAYPAAFPCHLRASCTARPSRTRIEAASAASLPSIAATSDFDDMDFRV